ncbi:MAG: hypothetical protein JRN08_08485, partial [Nitrososphaerota archaeon]|nr:hypothetical protein [Nitrososphaerota archaeon]
GQSFAFEISVALLIIAFVFVALSHKREATAVEVSADASEPNLQSQRPTSARMDALSDSESTL